MLDMRTVCEETSCVDLSDPSIRRLLVVGSRAGVEGLGELGDNATEIANLTTQMRTELASATAAGLQNQANAILARTTSSGPSNTVSGIMTWYQQHPGPGPYVDRDYALLSQAVIDLNKLIATANAVVAVGGSSTAAGAASSADADVIASLSAQITHLATQLQGTSLAPQVNTIMNRATTSGPTQTVKGAIAWYQQHPGPGPYTQRDRTLLQGAWNDLQHLAVQPTSSAPSAPRPSAGTATPSMPSAPSASGSPNTVPLPFPVPNFSAIAPQGTQPGQPLAISPEALAALQNSAPAVMSGGGPLPPPSATDSPTSTGAGFFSGTVTVPIVGDVPTPLVLLAAGLAAWWVKSSLSSRAPAQAAA